jgi:hypothetical protein
MSFRLSALLVLLWLSPAAAQETVTLRWRFPDGEAVGYRFDQERALDIRREGAQPASQRRSRKTSFVITGRATEGAESLGLVLKLLRMRERVVRGRDDRKLDTGTDDQEGNWPQARSMLQPIEILTDARGSAYAIQSFGGQALADMPAAERAHWESVLGEGIVRNLAFSLVGTFPADAVAKGASWQATTQLDIPGLEPLTMTVTNTVESITTRDGEVFAVLRQVGKADAELAKLGLEEWSQEGRIQFSVTRGQIASTEFVSRLVTNKEDGLVQVDTAHRLTRVEDEGEGEGEGDDGR